jgi:hypothetical protein
MLRVLNVATTLSSAPNFNEVLDHDCVNTARSYLKVKFHVARDDATREDPRTLRWDPT